MKPLNRIAFFSQGAKNWVAGTIYIHNLVRAIHYLPAEERPDLRFILSPEQDHNVDAELGSIRPKTHYYCCRSNHATSHKIREAAISLSRLRWPMSLEQVVGELKPSAIFPVQGWSLGKNFPTPWIGWIPDFQHKHLPQFFTDKEQQERDQTYEQLIKECRHLVLSSREAHKDLMRWYGASTDKVSVLPFASVATPQWFAGDPAQTVAEYQLPSKYVMFPSQFWVHKNHITVLKAMALLKARGMEIHLVSTGFTADYRRPEHFPMIKEFIKDNGLEGQVHILGLLPRAKQIHLMRAAAAIVQPSLFEGWSSLVEDSRTLGKAIFLSDIPIHREQQHPEAFYFAPEHSEELANLIALKWPHLRPGPDKAREERAYDDQTKRAQEFARAFLGIIRLTN